MGPQRAAYGVLERTSITLSEAMAIGDARRAVSTAPIELNPLPCFSSPVLIGSAQEWDSPESPLSGHGWD